MCVSVYQTGSQSGAFEELGLPWDSVLLQQHGEPLQASGVQAKASGHQALVEGAEAAVVLADGLDRSQPLHVDHLSAPQEKADPLLEPVRLLLQAAIAGQLLKQLGRHRQRTGQKNRGEKAEKTWRLWPHYFGPLVMDVHGPQHDVSRGVHP